MFRIKKSDKSTNLSKSNEGREHGTAFPIFYQTTAEKTGNYGKMLTEAALAAINENSHPMPDTHLTFYAELCPIPCPLKGSKLIKAESAVFNSHLLTSNICNNLSTDSSVNTKFRVDNH